MKNLLISFLVISIFIYSCKKKEEQPIVTPNQNYTIGKNRFTVQVDGDIREYYVHVPSGYSPSSSTAVVFMLHGSGGDGEKFYNISGWKEVGEQENILTVFPSSWTYCIIDNGVQKITSKWNVQPVPEWSFCPGETPRDDIKFLKTIISDLNTKFNINHKKIYLVGFSNGGQMAGKCSVEMSDVFAAIVESAGSLFSSNPNTQTYFPLRKLPIYYQRGNKDYGPGNSGPAAPLSSLSSLLTDSTITLLNGIIYRNAQIHINNFGLNNTFNISGDTNTVVTAEYSSSTGSPLNVFFVSLIKGLTHEYPNGINHPYKSAENNWIWLKQYNLP